MPGAVAYAYSEAVTMRIWIDKDHDGMHSRGVSCAAGMAKASLWDSGVPTKKAPDSSLSSMHLARLTIHDVDLLYEMLSLQAVSLRFGHTICPSVSLYLDSRKLDVKL